MHKYSNVEEMVGDLHELDHQGKILLEQGQSTFTIIWQIYINLSNHFPCNFNHLRRNELKYFLGLVLGFLPRFEHHNSNLTIHFLQVLSCLVEHPLFKQTNSKHELSIEEITWIHLFENYIRGLGCSFVVEFVVQTQRFQCQWLTQTLLQLVT